MIPLTLSLRNFLCYREDVPTLDFTGIHVACLCGPNGHGKSALLDAITWCLWGKARGKTHDDLISYGADQCSVELDFLARDTHYRVGRTHARGGGRRQAATTLLQLQVISTSGPQVIAGNHVRETQSKIDQIVGMDYETFINSAFLLQGRADEFTNKTPSERKAVLAKILGLALYDRLQDRAKGRLAEIGESVSELEGALGEMGRQIDEIGAAPGELAAAVKGLAQLNQRWEQQRREAADAAAKVGELERQLGMLEEVGRQTQDLRQEIGQLELASQTNQARILEFQLLIRQRAETRQGADLLKETRRRFEELEEASRNSRELNEAMAPLARAIDNGRTRLEAQAEQLRVKLEIELPAKAGGEPELLNQMERSRNKLDALSTEDQAIALQREEHQILSTRVGEAHSVSERYKAEGQELAAKLALLRDTGNAGAVCPLCRTPLGEDGCGRLADTYQADIAEKRKLYRLNFAQLKGLEEERANLEKDLARREQANAQSRRKEELETSRLQRAVEEIRLAQIELAESRTKLCSITASLVSGDFAVLEQTELKRLEAQIAALGYDEEARRQAYEQVQELQPFAEKFRRLDEAEDNLPREEELAARSLEILERRREDVERLGERHNAAQEAVAKLPQWRSKLKEAEEAQKTLEGEREALLARRGFLEGQVRRLEVLEQDMLRSYGRLSGLREDRSIYQELVTGLGQQGVQAMLIETVVPRLEEEANLLLGRMTDNRMHLSLNTQRERRTGRGDPIETLEIQVNDELGPRSYEMYSGGEAFRVNLALRIALSKVLAQRMGAPLPTLFIDEGFGTQDAPGRERILDVIGAIQDDFDKIIVITHLDELKDVFPARIEVQKGDRGSTFRLS